jgi:septal ring factor EnvC (AmiA/AmiB activator)
MPAAKLSKYGSTAGAMTVSMTDEQSLETTIKQLWEEIYLLRAALLREKARADKAEETLDDLRQDDE